VHVGYNRCGIDRVDAHSLGRRIGPTMGNGVEAYLLGKLEGGTLCKLIESSFADAIRQDVWQRVGTAQTAHIHYTAFRFLEMWYCESVSERR